MPRNFITHWKSFIKKAAELSPAAFFGLLYMNPRSHSFLGGFSCFAAL